MARNTVLKLWTTIVTAFIALFTALGLVSATTATAVPQTETPRNSDAHPTLPSMSRWSWSPTGSWPHVRALPPTMKQRIHAEAHGRSPSCRHRPLDDTTESDELDALGELTAPLAC